MSYNRVEIDGLSDGTQAVAVIIPRKGVVVTSVYQTPSITNVDFEEDITKIFKALVIGMLTMLLGVTQVVIGKAVYSWIW